MRSLWWFLLFRRCRRVTQLLPVLRRHVIDEAAWLSCSTRMYAAMAHRSRGATCAEIIRHCAKTVADDVVEVADLNSREPVNVIGRRPLESAS